MLKNVGNYQVGDGTTQPEKPYIRMGPLRTSHQREELEEQVSDAVDKGTGFAGLDWE